jgi:Tfp pilus assembly protein PilF
LEDAQETLLREALRLRSDYADAHSNLALVFHEWRELALERTCFEAALRPRADHVDALFNLCNLLQKMGYAEQAVWLRQQAHQRAPQAPDIVYNSPGHRAGKAIK